MSSVTEKVKKVKPKVLQIPVSSKEYESITKACEKEQRTIPMQVRIWLKKYLNGEYK